METSTPLEGKGSTFYIDYYGAMYMGGCMAHYGASDLLTVLLANPYTQTVREAGEGFIAGYNDSPHWDDRFPVQLHVRYLSEEPVGGFILADSTALRIYDEEKHFLEEERTNEVTFVPICGGAMHTIIRALHARMISTDNYVGIDGDMTDDDAFCVFSIVKHIDKVTVDYIGLWLNGSMPKHQTLGLADGATGAVWGKYNYSGKGGYYRFPEKVDMDSLRQVAIRKEEERYEK
jgi:basic membrane protein A